MAPRRRTSVERCVTHLSTAARSLAAVGPPLLATLCETLGYDAGALWSADAPADGVRYRAWWHVVGLPGAVTLGPTRYLMKGPGTVEERLVTVDDLVHRPSGGAG